MLGLVNIFKCNVIFDGDILAQRSHLTCTYFFDNI